MMKINKNTKLKIITSLTLATSLALPFTALAGIPTAPGIGSFTSITGLITPVLNLMWQIFIALAFIMTLVAAFLFVTAQGEPNKLSSARAALIWAGVSVGIAIIAFSIPNIIYSIFFP